LFVSIFIDSTWVTTFARSTSSAVNYNLSIKSNWSWVVVLEHNVESISKS